MKLKSIIEYIYFVLLFLFSVLLKITLYVFSYFSMRTNKPVETMRCRLWNWRFSWELILIPTFDDERSLDGVCKSVMSQAAPLNLFYWLTIKCETCKRQKIEIQYKFNGSNFNWILKTEFRVMSKQSNGWESDRMHSRSDSHAIHFKIESTSWATTVHQIAFRNHLYYFSFFTLFFNIFHFTVSIFFCESTDFERDSNT